MDYAKIALDESKKYYNYPNLIGIVWIGSTTFGVSDEWADIDLRLVVADKSRPMQQYVTDGVKIEVDEMNWKWLFATPTADSEQVWIIDRAIVLDDPENKINKKLNEFKERIKGLETSKLLWKSYGQLYLTYDLEKSLKRNQIITAQIILAKILEALSQFIFLYQRRILPPQKWRWYLIEKEKLFEMDKVNTLAKLSIITEADKILAMLKAIQKDCQKMMLDAGWEKERVLEPWRF